MRPAIPTDLLLRLMNATPEQYAAVEKVLAAVPLEASAPVDVNVAQAAFALMVKLDATGKQKAPTPLTVFRHYCIEGLSAEKAASKCRCSKATVMGHWTASRNISGWARRMAMAKPSRNCGRQTASRRKRIVAAKRNAGSVASWSLRTATIGKTEGL